MEMVEAPISDDGVVNADDALAGWGALEFAIVAVDTEYQDAFGRQVELSEGAVDKPVVTLGVGWAAQGSQGR